MEHEKWEYELFVSTDVPTPGRFSKMPNRDAVRHHLNALGQQGWEIVNAQFAAVGSSNFLLSALLKRRTK